MPISEEQVRNVINYLTLDTRKVQMEILIHSWPEAMSLKVDTKEDAILFTKMVASTIAPKDPEENNNDLFIIQMGRAIMDILIDDFNNNSFLGLEGLMEIIRIIEKVKGRA